MIVISEFFTVESQLVILKKKTISLLIECMVDFMLIFEKKWPISPTFTLLKECKFIEINISRKKTQNRTKLENSYSL
jgi:hypothetical protein